MMIIPVYDKKTQGTGVLECRDCISLGKWEPKV